MKYLIIGAGGQLGREFCRELSYKDISFVALTHKELDITKEKEVFIAIKQIKPSVIINCAAYTNVDRAEIDYDIAHRVNALGVKNISGVCEQFGIILVHYSTDYVFDGEKEGLYIEEDKPNPLNLYAKSKYEGELIIQNILKNYIIFRTSWIYGEGTQNFLYKLSQWSQKNDSLKIACDEFSVPTSTKTIVEITLKALRKNLRGLYHLVNTGYCSRYEWAKEYFKLKRIKKFIYPVYQSYFNLPAKRPKWSAMSNSKISEALNLDINDWKEEMDYILKNIYNY